MTGGLRLSMTVLIAMLVMLALTTMYCFTQPGLQEDVTVAPGASPD